MATQKRAWHVGGDGGKEAFDYYADALLALEAGYYAFYALELSFQHVDALAFLEFPYAIGYYHSVFACLHAADYAERAHLAVGNYQRSLLHMAPDVGVLVVEAKEREVVVVVNERLYVFLSAVGEEYVGKTRHLYEFLFAVQFLLCHDGGVECYAAMGYDVFVRLLLPAVCGAQSVPVFVVGDGGIMR